MTRPLMPVLGLAMLLAIPAHAQTTARAFVDGQVVARELASSAAAITDLMDRGNKLAVDGKFRKAAHAFHAAAAAQLRVGELPDVALWQEANMYFALGDNAHAAATLATLGERASEYGNPVAEVRAKMNAALLYARVGDVERAATLTTELQTLRKSPFIGDELRAELDLRLGRQ